MITWTIAQLERNSTNGGVITAHWRVQAVDGEYTAASYGTCGFTPDPTDPSFIAFENLTEADVLAWVYEAVNKEETESRLLTEIEEKKAPATVAGVPW